MIGDKNSGAAGIFGVSGAVFAVVLAVDTAVEIVLERALDSVSEAMDRGCDKGWCCDRVGVETVGVFVVVDVVKFSIECRCECPGVGVSTKSQLASASGSGGNRGGRSGGIGREASTGEVTGVTGGVLGMPRKKLSLWCGGCEWREVWVWVGESGAGAMAVDA